MADVLTVVAKVRAAKGKGDALAALPGCLVYRRGAPSFDASAPRSARSTSDTNA